MEKENFNFRNKEFEKLFFGNYDKITHELTKSFNDKIAIARDPSYVFDKLRQEQSNVTNDRSRNLGFSANQDVILRLKEDKNLFYDDVLIELHKDETIEKLKELLTEISTSLANLDFLLSMHIPNKNNNTTIKKQVKSDDHDENQIKLKISVELIGLKEDYRESLNDSNTTVAVFYHIKSVLKKYKLTPLTAREILLDMKGAYSPEMNKNVIEPIISYLERLSDPTSKNWFVNFKEQNPFTYRVLSWVFTIIAAIIGGLILNHLSHK